MNKSMRWLAIMSLLLAIIMCFSLVACGGGDKDSDTDTNTNTDTDVAADSFTVTFKQEGEEDVVITVESGKTIEIPAPKAVAGYTVEWDQDLTGIAITQNVIVNAEKTPVQNTINYNVNGGANATTNPTKFTVEDEFTFAAPTRTGYDFKGWYTDMALTTPITGIAAGTATPVVNVYAKWEAASYTITYNTDGGTNASGNPTTYTVESTGSIAAATKSGYEFLGWYLDSGKKVTSLQDLATLGSNVTLIAKYRLERYTITYVNANSISVVNNNVTDFDKEETVTFVDPSRNGYTFDGWYTEETFVNKITGIAAGTEGNQTVYAKWVATKYTITYKYNVDDSYIVEDAENISEYSIETNFELKAPTVISGYEFAGWFIENTSDEVDAIIPGEHSGNLVLVGKIQIETFKIIYHLDGDLPAGAPLTFTAENVGDNKIVLPTPTRTGYEFNGWYTEETFNTPITSIDGSIKKSISVYAKWTVITYTIEYVVGQDGVTNNNPTQFTAAQKVVFEALEKEGFVFVGWIVDGTGEAITSTQDVYSNLKLVAKWREICTDPTFVLNAEHISSAVANEDNTRKDKGMNLFDGDTVSAGLYSDGNDWFGVVGDTLTITFAEEMDVNSIIVYALGNWTTSHWTAFKADGEKVIDTSINANSSGESEALVVYDGFNQETGITTSKKIKTIVIEITAIKWDSPRTHKISEVVVTVVNPDYEETQA